MVIIGAGMSGLLAAEYFKHLKPHINEKGDKSDNHKALLRFRTSAVSELTGIPFKKVIVDKYISNYGMISSTPNLKLNNLYSHKTTGVIKRTSIMDLDTCERYIAPDDFIGALCYGKQIEYGTDAIPEINNRTRNGGNYPIISTMPVETLAEALNYDLKWKPRYKSIMTITFNLSDVDVYQTVYYPIDNSPVYRISITGNKVIAELTDANNDYIDWVDTEVEKIKEKIFHDFGISKKATGEATVSRTKYGKLIPCENDEVRKFISWATREYNIYSLGRWGTHRQILMDDVVHDLKVIERLITTRY